MSLFCSQEVFEAALVGLTPFEQRAVELCKGETRFFLGRNVVEYLDSEYWAQNVGEDFDELAGDVDMEEYDALSDLVFGGGFHDILKKKAEELKETVLVGEEQ